MVRGRGLCEFSEQVFASEVNGTQDVILNVLEPQETELKQVLCYPSVLAKKPGRTTLVKHYINVRDVVPVQKKSYRIPYSENC